MTHMTMCVIYVTHTYRAQVCLWVDPPRWKSVPAFHLSQPLTQKISQVTQPTFCCMRVAQTMGEDLRLRTGQWTLCGLKTWTQSLMPGASAPLRWRSSATAVHPFVEQSLSPESEGRLGSYVLDICKDNKKLCLNSGEIIKLSPVQSSVPRMSPDANVTIIRISGIGASWSFNMGITRKNITADGKR